MNFKNTGNVMVIINMGDYYIIMDISTNIIHSSYMNIS